MLLFVDSACNLGVIFDTNLSFAQHIFHHISPISQRIEFKLCLLTFKSFRGMAPQYLVDLCCSTSAAEIGHNLRSVTNGDPRVRRICTKFGDRAFSVAGPRAWNKLPIDIRSCDSVVFQTKTYATLIWYCLYGL